MGGSLFDDEGEEDEEPVETEATVDDDPLVVDSPQPQNNQLGTIQPVTDDLSQIKESYEQFEEVKTKLLDMKDDTETINHNRFITKSGWRKIATAFGVTTEIIREERTVEDGIVTWKVVAQANAPNGVGSSAVGMCASNETNFMEKLEGQKDDKPDPTLEGDVVWKDGNWRRIRSPGELKEHDIYATAATRAKNRAISDLVGGGEVSSEEIDPKETF